MAESAGSARQNREQEAYEQLQAYTLARGDTTFIHQHVVDAWAAQHATGETKPIGLTFALVGLYLHLDRGFTGREVQRAHMLLARRKHQWPAFELPGDRGTMTAIDVMTAPAGPPRDRAIDDWCASVWNAYRASHHIVIALLKHHGID
jgi:hypothetical protein